LGWTRIARIATRKKRALAFAAIADGRGANPTRRWIRSPPFRRTVRERPCATICARAGMIGNADEGASCAMAAKGINFGRDIGHPARRSGGRIAACGAFILAGVDGIAHATDIYAAVADRGGGRWTLWRCSVFNRES